MLTLKGDNIFLRALENEDLDFLYNLENDESHWELSSTQTPYSKSLLKAYLKNAHQDIYEAKQLRMVISDYNNRALGLIDIFDFDFKNKRAGIGIIIAAVRDRGKGYGKEALKLLVEYCLTRLNLHQLYCNIAENNTKSLNLFQQQGFTIVGLKKDWNFNNKKYANEYLLQYIKK